MTKEEKLREYEKKRDFRRSPEPRADKKADSGQPIFVIQKHDASSLHYDVRLQVDDVLVSWAVPKGPSTDPREKRLAVPTEDHPLEYAQFEGVIPPGEYGAGTVMVWDTGPYKNLRAEKPDDPKNMQASLEEGKVEVWLNGRKIKGGYALIRTGGGKDARWLLIKMSDDQADARRNPVSTQPLSVKTGRSLDEIAQQDAR